MLAAVHYTANAAAIWVLTVLVAAVRNNAMIDECTGCVPPALARSSLFQSLHGNSKRNSTVSNCMRAAQTQCLEMLTGMTMQALS